MNAIANDLLIQRLHWRYATKKFDPHRKISADDWRTLEQVLVLSPSSFGLQPYKFIVVTDQPLRERLVAATWNQRQVADCSHLVVCTVKRRLQEADVDDYLRRIAAVRGVPTESLAELRQIMVGALFRSPLSHHLVAWARQQAYIALGNFITSAALLGIDTCPMEGMEPAKYDEALDLHPRGLTTSVLCAAGYRAADDSYAALAKVRFPADQLIEHR